MAQATYVVDPSDWDEAAGPTGYEHARVLYGPLANRAEADSLMEGSYDDGIAVEMDRGDERPAPWAVIAADPRHEFACRAAELAAFWAEIPAERRAVLDEECGGLLGLLDAFRNAHAALPEED